LFYGIKPYLDQVGFFLFAYCFVFSSGKPCSPLGRVFFLDDRNFVGCFVGCTTYTQTADIVCVISICRIVGQKKQIGVGKDIFQDVLKPFFWIIQINMSTFV
jgi:hypothetical protein